MGNAIVQTREEVAIVPINRTLANQFIPHLGAGESIEIYFENATTTDGSFGNTNELLTPLQTNALFDEYSRVLPTSGNLLNVIVNANISGVEVRFYEAFNNDLFWRLADQVLVTAGLPTFIRGYRFIGHFGWISVYNGGLSNAEVGLMIRASTM